MAVIPRAISEWQRAVLRVHCAATDQFGSCFVIDAQRGLLWTCSHVVGQVPDTLVQIGAAPDVGQPVAWIYAAQVIHTTPQQEQRGLDGALLRITARLVGAELQPLALPGDQLTHADGGLLPSLPLGNDGVIQLPGDETAIILGYPALQGTHVMTPTVGMYSNTVQLVDGEWLLTDSTMCPGHSGGPGLNERGEVVGWNVRQVPDPIDGIHVPSGINHLRPVRLLIDELQGPAALAAFGGAPPADVREHLASQPGCIRGLLFGRSQAAAYAQQAREQANHAASAAVQAVDAAGEASDAAVEAVAAAARAGEAGTSAGHAATSAQQAVEIQALAIATTAAIDARAAALRSEVARQIRLTLPGSGEDWSFFGHQPLLESPATPQRMVPAAMSSSPSMSSSSPSSREPSPSRCSADVGIVIEGDFPDFDEDAFKRGLAKVLDYAVEWRDIDIDPATRRAETVARVQTGSCEVRVRCVVSGHNNSASGRSASSSTGSCERSDDEIGDAEVERIEDSVMGAVRRHWPRGVDVTDIRVRLKRNGSIILVLEMAQPLPVLLMQLAQKRSPQLLEAMSGRLVCCQLGGTVARLEGCEDGHAEALAQAMEDATHMLKHTALYSGSGAMIQEKESIGHVDAQEQVQLLCTGSASHKWWLQPDEFQGGPTGAHSQDGTMIQELRNGDDEVDIALQKLRLDRAEVEITNGALADHQALLLAQELATNTTVTRLDLSGAHRPPLSVRPCKLRSNRCPSLDAGNDFGEETGVAIAKALGKNTTLQSLDLSGAHLLSPIM